MGLKSFLSKLIKKKPETDITTETDTTTEPTPIPETNTTTEPTPEPTPIPETNTTTKSPGGHWRYKPDGVTKYKVD